MKKRISALLCAVIMTVSVLAGSEMQLNVKAAELDDTEAVGAEEEEPEEVQQLEDDTEEVPDITEDKDAEAIDEAEEIITPETKNETTQQTAE